MLGSLFKPIEMWAGHIPANGIQDNVINMLDVITLATSFNSSLGDDNYNTKGDLDMDNVINMSDVIILASNFNCNTSVYPEAQAIIVHEGFVDVTASISGSCFAIKEDGTVWTWYTSYYTPTKLEGLDNVKSLAAGYDHSLALKYDGTVWAWDFGVYGQLENGSYNNSSVPIKVKNLFGVKSIYAGRSLSYIIDNNGSVWRWGSANASNIPQKTEISGVIDLALGADHELALKEDGTVWGCGSNSYGKIGFTMKRTEIYEEIPGLTGVKKVAAGSLSFYVLLKNGTIISFGYNGHG
jgi:alpha-tubulin suppressor-like RCC1 family protein